MALVIDSGLYIEPPEDPCNVDGHRVQPQMHSGTDPAAPAEGTVTEVPRIIARFKEALGPEFVRLWEVFFIEMDY